MTSRLERRIKRREEREETVKKQHDQYRKRQRNKKIFNWSLVAIVILIAVYALYQFRGSDDGRYNTFAQCLTQKGAIMYGTDWCPHCQEQKRMFGDSFRYVTFINCDVNPDACSAAGVEVYPTWVVPTKPTVRGVQQLSTLAEMTQCTLQ